MWADAGECGVAYLDGALSLYGGLSMGIAVVQREAIEVDVLRSEPQISSLIVKTVSSRDIKFLEVYKLWVEK